MLYFQIVHRDAFYIQSQRSTTSAVTDTHTETDHQNADHGAWQTVCPFHWTAVNVQYRRELSYPHPLCAKLSTTFLQSRPELTERLPSLAFEHFPLIIIPFRAVFNAHKSSLMSMFPWTLIGICLLPTASSERSRGDIVPWFTVLALSRQIMESFDSSRKYVWMIHMYFTFIQHSEPAARKNYEYYFPKGTCFSNWKSDVEQQLEGGRMNPLKVNQRNGFHWLRHISRAF